MLALKEDVDEIVCSTCWIEENDKEVHKDIDIIDADIIDADIMDADITQDENIENEHSSDSAYSSLENNLGEIEFDRVESTIKPLCDSILYSNAKEKFKFIRIDMKHLNLVKYNEWSKDCDKYCQIWNKYLSIWHTLYLEEKYFVRDIKMLDVDTYFRTCNSKYVSMINVKEYENIPTPVVSDKNIRVGDILYYLSKTNDKSDIIKIFDNIDMKIVNLVLEYAADVMNRSARNLISRDSESEIDLCERQIDLLGKHMWPIEDIKNTFKFNPQEGDFFTKYSMWCRLKYKEPANENIYNVWRLEEYLSWMKCVPIKVAAAKLGMKPESLQEFIDKVIGTLVGREKVYTFKELINSDFVENISKYLFYNEIQDDYQQYCRKIHEIMSMHGVQVDPLVCDTSKLLQENPLLYAKTYDDITGEPVSDKYMVVLNFNKPISLRPWVCSVQTYVKYRDKLQKYILVNKPNEELIRKIEMIQNAE